MPLKPNISAVEHEKSCAFVDKITRCTALLREMGQDILADEMLNDEVFMFHSNRTTYTVRRDKAEKVPEARVPCSLCNSMVLKRGLKEHENNKKCQDIQEENLVCVKKTNDLIATGVLSHGKKMEEYKSCPTNLGRAYVNGLVIPNNPKEDGFFVSGGYDTTIIGAERKATHDALREKIATELEAKKQAQAQVQAPPNAQPEDISAVKKIKIKPRKLINFKVRGE